MKSFHLVFIIFVYFQSVSFVVLNFCCQHSVINLIYCPAILLLWQLYIISYGLWPAGRFRTL